MEITTLFAQEASNNGATAVGWAIFGILLVAFAVAIVLNVLKGRAEVGAEIELAANRKPYASDDELETKVLDRTLGLGLGLLGIIAVALPLYWLAEPSRQENAVANFEQTFINRGEALYNDGADCAACHGPAGTGGSASTVQLSDRGEYQGQITWQAPALDTVLYRYSEDEVFDILMYGRPNTPMPAWGSLGGGALTDQQLRDIIAYLRTVQLPAETVRANVDAEIEATCAPDSSGDCTVEGGEFATLGEAIFDMGLHTNFAGGAYSCGRCHTNGWSWGDPQRQGGGFLGPNLTGGSTISQFPSIADHVDFVSVGAERGQPYGVGGQADGGTMPGFGHNPNAVDPDTATMEQDQVMLTPEQVRAVVEYERGL